MASPDTRDTQNERPDERETASVSPAAVAAFASIACLLALAATLVAGGAVTTPTIPGLPDPGALTRWGLPLTKEVMNVAAALTVGLLLLAVFLLPSDRGALGRQSQEYVRAASWSALVWATAAGVLLVFQLSEILGQPPGEVVGNQLTSYAGSSLQGRALTLVVLAAVGVALLARTTGSATGVACLLGLTLAGMLPPPLTGHPATSPFHELAISGVALHVGAISLWVGGLAALTVHVLRANPEHAPTAVQRFSRMALWAYIGVGVSGVASAASRLYNLTELFTTSYGLIVVVKIALFGLLGYLGWRHRRWVVPRVAERGRGAFAQLAAVEVVIMGTVMGLSVALSRTAPPPPAIPLDEPGRAVLGFAVPPEVSLQTLLTLWRPDLFFALLVVVLGGLYLAGVARLRARGDAWPWGRTVAWFLGLLTIVVVKLTGVSTYSMVLFSVHMVQHMTLSMLTPALLVLGGPVTLALRALKPAQRRGDRGPREWLTLLMNSGFARFITHPGVVVPLFALSTYALYFTSLYETMMSDHLGHLAMSVHFLLAGYLFYWILIGVDPTPRKIPHLLRILLLLLTMAVHAFFGLGIMSLSEPIAMGWYGAFEVPWLASVLEDQRTGGGIAWSVGEIPTLLVLIVLLVQWYRDEERTERRRERHSRRDGSEDADLDAYNEYLASLERRARKQG